MSIVVRSARPDEVEQSRRLRLEMLADSPDSFNERLDDLERWPTSRWASRLTSSLAPDSTLLVAEVGGVWIGQAAGRLYAHYDPSAHMCWRSMWRLHTGAQESQPPW
ncbi:hypothetical protein [Tessaracoccus defluvii]|uniref:GNAT family N-acetyltransferase n=1 Tax=Tessaracoccus defluvii TaxID=1285901 RepID=A0A7H0H8R4_9ACTN|nr:hypothetical protein [Tessaracoccus defluvii]QNP56930.1 hypothetical protein H9L22_06240 [Tessaracoccus defluvii]